MDWTDRALILAVLIAVPLLIVVFPLYLLLGGLRTFALRPLQQCYDGMRLREQAGPGDVQFTYHTYRGLLLWVTQDEHRIVAPPEDAELLLLKLLRFNFTWGMLSYGMVFIPFVALANYYSQRKLIQQQLRSGEASKTKDDAKPCPAS